MTRVAITTDRFGTAAPPFVDHGLDPVPTPCIRVEAADDETLDRARAAAVTADLLLITSARTVDIVWSQHPMPDAEVVAVGARTAAAVEAAGGRVAINGRAGLAGLIELAADRLSDARVSFPHASGSDAVAMERLRALVPAVEEHVVYRTVPVAPGPTPVDAVVFASPSAVEGWMLTRHLDDLAVGVIGETTSVAVSRYRAPDVVASRPSYRALAQALLSHLEVME